VTDKSNKIHLSAKNVTVTNTTRQWLIQGMSTLFIFAGLALIGFGIWTPLRDYLFAQYNAPPPLPAESAAIPLPEEGPLMLPDNALPADEGEAAIADDQSAAIAGSSLADNPLPAAMVLTPTATVKPTATPLPTPMPPASPTPLPTPEPVVENSQPDSPPSPIPPTPTPLPTETPDPFPPAQLPPDRIIAPAINLDSTIVEVGWSQREVNGQLLSVWDVAEFAAGWHKNSARPGHLGNIVLSGHHNILGEVFRYIVDLEPGDMITLYADGRPYQYRIEDKFIVKDKGEPVEVRQANARWISEFTDQRLTMVTCWPYNNNTHRVIVIAKPYVEGSSELDS